MTKTTTIDVNNIQQLIDLNGEMTNFKITFNVKSEDGSEFNAVVIDQHTLDNNATPEFKTTKNGELSGTIIADKNVFQNYYLALKSDKPVVCTLNIDIEEIPPQNIENFVGNSDDDKSIFSNWKIILLIVGILCVVGYGIYMYFFAKSPNTEILSSIVATENSIPVLVPTPIEINLNTEPVLSVNPSMTPVSSASSIKSSASAYNANNIMSRLNKLSI